MRKIKTWLRSLRTFFTPKPLPQYFIGQPVAVFVMTGKDTTIIPATKVMSVRYMLKDTPAINAQGRFVHTARSSYWYTVAGDVHLFAEHTLRPIDPDSEYQDDAAQENDGHRFHIQPPRKWERA